MNWLDIVMLLIVGLSALFGFWRGFVREALAVAAWIAGLVIARIYSPVLAELLSGMLANETARYVLAFALLVLLTLIVGAIISHFLRKLLHQVGFAITDRLLGLLFGVARGAIIILVIIFFARPYAEEATWWQASQLMPYAIDLLEWSQLFIEDYTSQDESTAT